MVGTIQCIDYSKGSGIATLVLLDQSGDICRVHCDAGPLFRSIEASGANLGTLINYSTGDIGLMAGFALVDDGA